jgi:hypothetical protein
MAAEESRQGSVPRSKTSGSAKGSGEESGKSRFELLLSFFQALLIAGLGVFFTDRVSNAIKQRELDLANVKEMRELLLELQSSGLTREQARADAAGLAAFGPYAIIPFIDLVQDGEDNQALAAESGLRSVALGHAKEVASAMTRVVQNRTRFYSWRAHQFAIDLLGELDWKKALPELESYALQFPADSASDSLALSRFSNMVRDDPPPTTRTVVDLRTSLNTTLGILKGEKRSVP